MGIIPNFVKATISILSLGIILIFMFNINKNEEINTLENSGGYLYINYVDSNLNHRFFQYDFSAKKNKELLSKGVTEYPTATFSRMQNEVYFTAETNEQTSQLFKTDFKNNKTIQITKDQFYHVDLLEIDQANQKVFMRVLEEKNDRNFQLAIYDLNTKNLYKWGNRNKDTTVSMMDYNPHFEQILVVTNSVKEEFEKVNEANKKGTLPKSPSYTFSIYNKEGKRVKDIASIDAFLTGVSLSSDGKNILISYYNNLEEQTSKIASIDVETQKMREYSQDSSKLSRIREPIYNSDKSGFYFLADIDKPIIINNEKVKGVTINFYDIKKKVSSEVWFKEDGQVINFHLDDKSN